MTPTSPRLRFRRLSRSDGPLLHRIATEPFVRRWLLDGEVVGLDWCDREIADAEALYASTRLGLWGTFDGDRAIGFCGFRVFPEVSGEAELLVAFVEDAAGNGLGTEATAALLRHAHGAGHPVVHSAADEPNVASIRMLRRCGFVETGAAPGAFGRILLFQHREPP